MGFFDAQVQLIPQSVVESTQENFTVFLLTYKNEEDPIKNEGDIVLTRFYPL